jgi:hypothetical protein
MKRFCLIPLIAMLSGCATTNGQSACAECGLGAYDRTQSGTVEKEREAWVRYFAAAMVNQELETIVDYSEVIVTFRFHNNSNYPIDSVTLQLGNEVWEDNLGTRWEEYESLREPGCTATVNCSAQVRIQKSKFCDKMNGRIWLTHIQDEKIEPINLMPTKAAFCGVQ